MPRAASSATPAKKAAPKRLASRPILNKHQQKTVSTKRKLHLAALRIFARDGFEAARIDDIAAEAGYTRGAFYAHFQSKEDLFFAMLEYESQRYLERIRKTLETCQTDECRVQTLRESYVRRAGDRQWSILILEFKLYALRHPKLRAKLAELHRSIREKIRLEGFDWMQCTPRIEETLKVTLQAVLNSLVLESAYDSSTLPESKVKTILREVFDFFLAAASKRDSARRATEH